MARKGALITSWDDVPIVMDIPFAARIVGLTPESLKMRARAGKFPAYKEGVEWRVEKEALREHMRRNRVDVTC